MFKASVYKNRRDPLKKKLNSGIVLILGNQDVSMSYPANIFEFRQDSSFLYLFGLNEPNLAGVIDIDNNKEYIFGNDVDIEDIIWMGPQISIKEKASRSGIENTDSFNSVGSFIKSAMVKGQKIHFLPPYRAKNKILLNEILNININNLKENASIELIEAMVSLREIKEDVEIQEILKACDTSYLMHTTAMKIAKEGVLEKEIAGIIEGIAISRGAMISFPVILSQNGETLHNHDHSQLLQNGRLMLTDAGAETTMNYCSDNTRTVPVSGKFTTKQREIYELVLAANNNVMKFTKPGIFYKEAHMIAAKTIAQGLIDLGLMKGNVDEAVAAGAHAMFFPHGLGHMMGLDVHDMENYGEDYVGYDNTISRADQFGTAYLRLAKKMKPGYVFTNEPGIYFVPALIDKWKTEKINNDFINFDKVNEYRDFGGIRLEDDLVITETGCKMLGKRIPITVKEIEDLMSK
jgi:Xaa-Pro aminopeptidase